MSQMVTTCANCRQQLAVTAADLRVGQGFVRCGRCDKVFNALLTLTESEPADSEPEAAARGTTSVPALDEQDVLPPLPGREEEEDSPFGSMDDVEVVETHATGQYRSLVLEGDDIRPDELVVEPQQSAGTNDEVAREVIRQATSQPIDILLAEEEEREPAVAAMARSIRPPAAVAPPDPEPFDADEALGNPRRVSGLWYAAAVVLALALVVQYVHLNRHALVTEAWLQAPLQKVYGLLGETVEPAWNLADYEISQLGWENTDGAQTLVLRAAVAVKKDAPHSQPPPLIRAVLSDRYGNVVGKHEQGPSDWLLGEAPERIAPGQRLDAQLSMSAPAGVTSYSLHPCLPDSAGQVHCTDDPLP
jgi:predicted Zn finger-like uncharacterized protein